jgi:hypothetical protein
MMGGARTSGRSFALNSIVLAFVSEMIPKAKVLMQTAVKNQYSGEPYTRNVFCILKS